MRLEWKMQESYISLLTDIIANVADVDAVIGPDGVTDERRQTQIAGHSFSNASLTSVKDVNRGGHDT